MVLRPGARGVVAGPPRSDRAAAGQAVGGEVPRRQVASPVDIGAELVSRDQVSVVSRIARCETLARRRAWERGASWRAGRSGIFCQPPYARAQHEYLQGAAPARAAVAAGARHPPDGLGERGRAQQQGRARRPRRRRGARHASVLWNSSHVTKFGPSRALAVASFQPSLHPCCRRVPPPAFNLTIPVVGDGRLAHAPAPPSSAVTVRHRRLHCSYVVLESVARLAGSSPSPYSVAGANGARHIGNDRRMAISEARSSSRRAREPKPRSTREEGVDDLSIKTFVVPTLSHPTRSHTASPPP